MKAVQIIELLRIRHEAPEWATFTELPNATGSYYSGRMDFFAFNMYPSKRFLKIAYEVKVTLADFMKELDSPLKRAFAERFSDECYFACPRGLVMADEMPDGWGLIEADRGGLKIKKRAAQKKVDSLPIEFVAAIARKSSDPPSKLPAVLWRYAGEELDYDQLLMAAEANIEEFAALKKRDGENEFMRSDGYKTDRKILAIICDKIGWKYSRNPDELAEWFDKNFSFSGEENKVLFDALRSVRDKIDRILP